MASGSIDRERSDGEVARLLERLDVGDDPRPVLDRLVPLLYAELKQLAHTHRWRWDGRAGGHGTTSLVHEAYARLAAHETTFSTRGRFFQLASRTMRSVLVDNARRALRQKRGGGEVPVRVDLEGLASEERFEEILALHDGLDRLAAEDPELVRIVECRSFAGLTIEETAEALEISPATVKRRHRLARAWLYRELGRHDADAQ